MENPTVEDTINQNTDAKPIPKMSVAHGFMSLAYFFARSRNRRLRANASK
jgi:hypothetical protein